MSLPLPHKPLSRIILETGGPEGFPQEGESSGQHLQLGRASLPSLTRPDGGVCGEPRVVLHGLRERHGCPVDVGWLTCFLRRVFRGLPQDLSQGIYPEDAP